MDINPSEVTKILKEQIKKFGDKAEVTEVGQVLSVGDGIARVYGLDNVQAGEMVEFPDKIKEVRGKGLLTAFEMHDDPKLDGHAVSVGLLNQGVYAKETHHTTVRLAPALTINKNQIDSLVSAIGEVIKDL